MDLYWYLVVILFVIIKIFFYICWYRSRQRQLAAYIGNPCNDPVVIVGGRAYRHHERQNTSVWPNQRGGGSDGFAVEPSGHLPPTAPYPQPGAPPPYQAISRMDELKPPPYSECVQGGAAADAWPTPATATPDPRWGTGAPPPYKTHPHPEGPSGAGLIPYPGAGEGRPGPGLIPYPGAGEGPSGTGLISYTQAGEGRPGPGLIPYPGAGEGWPGPGLIPYPGAGEGPSGPGLVPYPGAGEGRPRAGL